MIFLWLIVPILILIAAYFFMNKVVYHSIQYFFSKKSQKQQKRLSWWITGILFLPILLMQTIVPIVVSYFIGFTLLFELIRILLHRLVTKQVPQWVSSVYYSGVIGLLFAVLLTSYGYYNMCQIVETDYMVTTEKSIQEKGYRIALLSDLHYGLTLSAEELEKQARRIEEQHPDVVILCGDLVDERTTKKQLEEVFPILGGIDATYGVYYVYGNHDRATYRSDPAFTPEELEQVITNAGITILEDTTACIGNEITLIGRQDKAEERASIESLIKDVDSNQYLIVLDHQPSDYRNVKNAGIDMILSGHTHGGQIWPGGILADLFYLDELNYGYKKIGGLHAIVTSGMAGWGFPIRTERHSEFVMIQLKPVNY